MTDTVATLSDRAAAIDVVIGYAMALDRRDWAVFRALFQDNIEIDYSSMGSIHAKLPADEWTARCRALEGFDRTLHRVSNFVCTIKGDAAQVVSYVDAAHFLKDGDEDLAAYGCGIYTHDMVRVDGVWRISKCRFDLAGQPGGKAQFDQAFARARAIAASKGAIPAA